MVDAMGMLAASDPMQHVLPHPLFHIGPFTFTNHLLMLLITAAIMLVVFPALARNYPMVPRGPRNLFEMIMQFIRTEVAQPSLHHHTDRFVPFLWTLFFFILFNNLLGLVPLDPLALLIVGRGHVLGTATAGLSVTAGLAVVSFVLFHGAGIVEQYSQQVGKGKPVGTAAIKGVLLYLNSMVPHVPGVIGMILYLPLLGLEMVLSLVKPFALAIRLFANMMAGHVVLASLLLMIPVLRHIGDWGIAVPTLLGCTFLSLLELLVAFLQAYIFVFLTCMFIGAAVSPEH